MEQKAVVAITEQVPKEVVLAGRAAAKELTAIVSSRPRKLVMAGKQYLFFEDWQTIGKFYGVTAKVVSTEELKEDDKLVGFLAHAVAVTNQYEVSAADGECTRDEPNWREKPRFQLRSMAQTRACAKALRNCLGWVAVLAGYEATPAEEMADNVRKPASTTRKPAEAKAKTSAPAETNGKVPPLKDLGDLYTRAGKFGLSPRDVCEAVGVGKGEEIIDMDEAWVATAKKFASTIKVVQEANK